MEGLQSASDGGRDFLLSPLVNDPIESTNTLFGVVKTVGAKKWDFSGVVGVVGVAGVVDRILVGVSVVGVATVHCI